MRLADQWALLGIAPTDDPREIKRAYARTLKTVDVDADPAAFIALRQAMEAATEWGTKTPWWEEDQSDEALAGVMSQVGEGDGTLAAGPDDGGYNDDDEYADSEDWRTWRPQRPVFATEGPGPAVGELEDLLYAEAAPDPERVHALGQVLLAHPDLDHVDQAVAVERWLAEAIANNFPRSDPLIGPALARFGWKDHARLSDWSIGRIIQRRDDLAFRQLLGRTGHPHGRAFAELSGPPRRKLGLTDFGLASKVWDFLAFLPARPTLESDLDPESVAWWRAYFTGPHLPLRLGRWWSGTTLALAVAGLIVLNPQTDQLLLPFSLLIVAGAILSFAGLKAWAHLAAWRRRERDRHWEREPATGLPRTAALTLLLPLPFAVLPSAWPAAALAAALTAALGWKVLRSGWIAPEWLEPSNRPRVFLPTVAGLAGLVGALQLPPAGAAALGLPLLLAAWAGSFFYAPLREAVGALPRQRRVALVLGALLALAAAAAAVALTMGQAPRPAIVFALVPAAVVAAHLATAWSDVDSHILEWPLRAVLVIFYFTARLMSAGSLPAILFTVTACYGLGYAFIRAGFVLKDEAAARER